MNSVVFRLRMFADVIQLINQLLYYNNHAKQKVNA